MLVVQHQELYVHILVALDVNFLFAPICDVGMHVDVRLHEGV